LAEMGSEVHRQTPALAPEVVLDVADLKTEFHLRHANVRAVDGVSFTVSAGECVGLVGESGCGKSTTGLSIMKLLPGVGHITAAPFDSPDEISLHCEKRKWKPSAVMTWR